MKGVFVSSVLFAVVLSALGSVQLQRPTTGDLRLESFQDNEGSSADVTSLHHHGNRMKRSPLDPIVAPLLIGKSFLYGALIGPKLFHKPRYYYHHRPHYVGHGWGHYGGGYGAGYGHGWGWGHGK